MISVIIPVYSRTQILLELRKRICTEKDAELILVIQAGLNLDGPSFANESFLHSTEIGRGNNFALGLDRAKGEIILLNHSDTLLPMNWYRAIVDVMKDTDVSGGGFHLRFDRYASGLRLLTWLSDFLFYMTGEMWGDRSIFARTSLLKSNRAVIDVPIMEDVRLSRLLNKTGRMKMLKEHVVTSSHAFMKRGVLKHVLRILQCRLSYLMGHDVQKIYSRYYA